MQVSNSRLAPGLRLALRDHGLSLLLVLLASIGLRCVPLFDVLGFEYAAAVGWLLTYVGGFRAVRAAVRARSAATTIAFPGRACVAVLAGNLALALVPLAIAVVDSHRVPTCNWREGLAFYALFPIPGILYGTCLGFGLGLALALRRARTAFVLFSLATYVVAIWFLVREPPKFAFNAFVGYFPGPIYDSEVRITPALLVARAVVLVQAALFASLAFLGWDGARWRPRAVWQSGRGENSLAGLLALVASLALVVLWLFRAPLGLQIDRSFIQKTLGGRVETPHCVVFYDRGSMDEAQVRRLADEHETRWVQLAAWFGLEPRRKIGSYVYASAEQKKRLMGAAGTSFEDALHDEFHINASSENPHPVLTHEMAHIFAAQIDRWVPICWKIGIHEGIAVAAEWDDESARLEMTPHQACAAMDSLHLLPDLRHSLSAFGFWTQPGARAYTACGSFVRWLIDTRGMPRFRVLWRRGDFARAYGESGEALLGEWSRMLQSVAIGPAELRRAERLFRPGSVFAQDCAHEQARLEAAAGAALGRGDVVTAESLYARLVEISPDDPARLLELGRARLRRGDAAGAALAARTVLDAPGAAAGQIDRAWRLLGDAAWLAEGTDAAARVACSPESAFAAGARQAASTADRRAYEVALQVLADPRLRGVLRDYLADRGLRDEAGLARLVEARLAAPDAGLPRYLLGRRLLFAGEPERAAIELEAALVSGDLGLEAALAARELTGRAWLEAGNANAAAEVFNRLLAELAPEWRRRGWEDWRWRCARAGANRHPAGFTLPARLPGHP